MTRRRLLEELDSAELMEWLAYDSVEPLPDSYWQAGMLASVLAQIHSASGKKYKPQDFMPSQEAAAERRRAAEAASLARMQAFAARQNAKT